jgi:hypothetical protein
MTGSYSVVVQSLIWGSFAWVLKLHLPVFFEADNYNDCHAYFHTKFMIRFSTSTSVGLQLGASENASSFPSYQVPAAVAFAVVQLQSLAHPPATSETVPCI